MAQSKELTNLSTMNREMVRCVSADALIILIKIALIAFTFKQMLIVNDEARDTIININDYVTQFKLEISPSLYHSVSNTKYILCDKFIADIN